jgi:ATP-dependent helicase HrpB
MASPTHLPIEPLLADICEAVRTRRRLVLAAPPGAGKTTRVPLALAGLIGGFEALPGKVVMLEPRRLAARMAAERMAATLGERQADGSASRPGSNAKSQKTLSWK